MLAFVAASIALAGFAAAAPAAIAAAPRGVSRRAAAAGINDTVILQYALTLEHLEDTLYHQALAKFDAKAFKKAGYPDWVRGRFEQIAAHEASHVAFLTGALGADAVPACNYSFPYTDPKSFVALSQAIEGVGTSAYLGAAALITNPAYLTAAGSILTTEARHDSWVASSVQMSSGWSLPYDTPLDISGVFSLAGQFITGCPSGYKFPPYTAYPALTVSTATPRVGDMVSVKYTAKTNAPKTYLAFYSGLNVFFSEITGGQAMVPSNLTNAGTVYAAVVSNNTGMPSDSQTLSGLAILNFAFNAAATQPL